VVVLTVVGVLAAVGTLRVGALRDRMSVRAATTETVAAFAVARRWAISRAARTAVLINPSDASIVVQSFADTISHRRLRDVHGVAIVASRDSMAYAPNGLGYGASNLTLILRRGAAAETVVVSRLGRVRR
jgi:hypothetical protein